MSGVGGFNADPDYRGPDLKLDEDHVWSTYNHTCFSSVS